MSDLLAVVAVLAVVGAVLVMSVSRTRTMGQLGGSMANLRELGTAMQSYGLDNADRVATFSWKKGDISSQYPDLRNPVSDIDAAAYQMVDIIRRRADNYADFPRSTGIVPFFAYSHLVLIDYLGTTAPWMPTISPGDEKLLGWSRDPKNWQGAGAPSKFIPFVGSYQIGPAFISSPESGSNAVYQTNSSSYFIPVNARFGNRSLGEVADPSRKALMYERYQRFFGSRVGFFMYDEARVPVLTVDGAVEVRATKNTNAGWDPRTPTAATPSLVTYAPPSWEPPPLNGAGSILAGRMQWTRNGLGGRDFDGPEVPLP